MSKGLSFILLFCLTLSACQETPNTQPEIESSSRTEATQQEPVQLELTESYLIEDTSVFGISTGDQIEQHTDKLEKGLMRSGEGEFDVYYIKTSEGKELGFAYFEDDRPDIISDIYLTSPLVVTKTGIRVGDTYGKLKTAMPNLEVHGSEIESRVTATAGNLAFLLDTYSNEYNLDESLIKADTEIKMITILAPRK